MHFYKLYVNKARGHAQIGNILSGLKRYDCKHEEHFVWHPNGTLVVEIKPNVGRLFGEALYDGHWEQFSIISEKLLNFLSEWSNITEKNCFKVKIVEPLPAPYTGMRLPDYYVINYRTLYGGEIDLEHYPYKNAWRCPDCLAIRFDTEEFFEDIFKRRVKPTYFKLASWSGQHFFAVGTFGFLCTENLMLALKKNFPNTFTGISA